ncbi:MAG: DUF4309 domain-containing protein [Butyrivibrio sp.]|nr:DUF4309 domain-containing protein [Butyrivibrio sp.]
MKKNNPVVLLLLILIMGTVSACGFGGKSDDDASALEYNGVTFSIKDENMDNVYAAFGEPEDTEGDRPGYYYTFDSGMVGVSSFIINEIYEDRRQEFPDMISIKDERIKTSKGIGVGSAEEEVKTAYGKAEAFDLDGMSILSYSFDGYQMVFVVDKTVVEIQYVRGS